MRRRLLFLVFAVCALGSERTQAQPRVTAPYAVDFFSDGLPGQHVRDIEQMDDGYLWVMTNAGLARFDGHRFVTFDASRTGISDLGAMAGLHRNPQDTLFIAQSDGPIVSYAGGQFKTRLELGPGVHTGDSFVQDRTGRFIGRHANRGVEPEFLREDRGAFRRFPRRLPEGLGIRTLYRDSEGRVWTGAHGAEQNRRARAANLPPCAIGVGPAWRIQILDDGQLAWEPSLFPNLVIHPSRGEVLRSARSGNGVAFTSVEGEDRGRFVLPRRACPMLLDRDGTLWVKEDNQLAAYAPEEPAPLFQADLGFAYQYLTFPPMLEDREGTLWVGTWTRGLVRIRRNLFQTYVTTAVDGHAPVQALVAGTAYSVLIADANQDLYRARGTTLTLEPRRVAGRNGEGVYEDEGGRQLYFTEKGSESSIDRWIPGQPPTTVATPGRIATLGVRFFPDPRDPDVVWFHNPHHVYRLLDPFGTDPRIETVLTLPSPEGTVRSLLWDRRDAVWIATNIGAYRLTETDTTRFTQANGLPHDHVRSIHEDAAGDLWFGTYGGGLARYRDGVFATITEEDGLAENVVSSILEDEAGFFWMSGNRGVHRAARADLNAFLDGDLDRVPSVLYGRESGLTIPEGSGIPALAGPDGRFWFPTFGGASAVDPSLALTLGQDPPLVHAERLVASDTAFLALPDAPIRLAASQRRFTVGYVGLSLRHPEHVTYRYRLDGLDPDWIEAGTERQATYTNVPPGDYTFRVQARSFTGVWSEADGLLTFRVAPFFYETWWFLLLCGLAVLGLVAGGVRYRLRQAEVREAELNALVRARTEELEREKETVAAQADALRSLDEAKSRVFANISHEFRTPLTLILGPLEDLRESLPDDLSAPQHRPLYDRIVQPITSAVANGRRLLRLVNQLLDVSRLEAGRIALETQRLDAVQFVRAQAEAFSAFAERKQIAFRVQHPDGPLPVYLDAGQFEKVIANLLGNAFKFTPEGGTITLEIATESAPDGLENGPGWFVLRVQDSGPGIAPEHLAHLFERFYQADASSTRRHPGTGIGLALVKNLVELHGGTVEAESTLGEGATFTVRVPLGRDHLRDDEVVDADGVGADWSRSQTTAALLDELRPAPPPPSVDADADPDATTVLVVDDNPDVRHYVRRHLETRYRVLEAADGKQALALARAQTPDLVVSDVMMPEMDGFGLCRAIKEDPETDFIPVVLLTARASMDSKLEGLGFGADDYLTKPFDVRELEVRLDNLITSRQQLKARFGPTDAAPPDGEARPDLQPVAADSDPLVAQVRQAIKERLSEEDFGIDALAEAVGVSRRTLYRQLAPALGCTPMELLWTMRLERAAHLLKQQRFTVSEVAYGVGFKSVAHFCNRFREAYGSTPAAFASHPDGVA